MFHASCTGRERDEVQSSNQRDYCVHLHGKRDLAAVSSLRNGSTPPDVHHERSRARHSQPALLLSRALARDRSFAEHVSSEVSELEAPRFIFSILFYCIVVQLDY